MNRQEKYKDQGLDPDAEYYAQCKVCEQYHEWGLDDGLGGMTGQGWISCPEYGGAIPVGKDATVTKEEKELNEDTE